MLVATFLLLLAACSTTAAPTSVQTCDNSSAKAFIGQTGSSDTGEAIIRATHSGVLRWAPPGAALTMDFRIDRITVRLDAAGRIVGVDCG